MTDIDPDIPPCPFCGGPAQLGETESDYHSTWGVYCRDETCGAEVSLFASKEEALAAWSRRANPAEVDAKLRAAFAENLAYRLHQVQQLEAKLQRLKQEAAAHDAEQRRKNLALDALHYVWCDGGCAGGVHRWSDNTVTRALVDEAVRNTNRLIRWYANSQFRLLNPKDLEDYLAVVAAARLTTGDGTCPICKGKGWLPPVGSTDEDGPRYPCPTCWGAGRVSQYYQRAQPASTSVP